MVRKLTKVLSFLLCFLLIFEQSGFAQVAGQLDISGHILSLRNSLIEDKFRPLHIRSLSYDNLNNNFQLLLDKGDPKDIKSNTIEQTTKELLNYFFVGITLPNDSFWVNLRPDSPDNIIDPALGTTDVGKILLEADLHLKKDTAKYTSPETPEGKKYWDKLYKKAEEILGYENSTIPTLTRPWIVPGEIIIRETESDAYIYKATLKVMLEEDYLKSSATYNFKDERLKQLNEYSSQLLRELIIPKLTKEVNTARRYAPLRQVYYSLILAQWFKQKFYGRGGLYSWLIDKKELNGLTSKTSWSKTTYFKEYQKSFKEGEYNLKEPVNTPYGQTIRSYFSGGIAFGGLEGQGILDGIRKGLIAAKRNILELPKNLKYIIRLSAKGGTVSNPSSIEVVNVEIKDDGPSSVSSVERTDIPIKTPQVNSNNETNKIREFIERFSKSQKAKLNNSLLKATRIGKDEKQIREILNRILRERPYDVEAALGVYQRYPQGFTACIEAGFDLNEIVKVELLPPGVELKAASRLEELAEVFQSSRVKGNLLVQIRDNEKEYRYALLGIRLEKEYGDAGIQLAHFAKRNGINEPDGRDLELFLDKDYKLDTSELLKFLQDAQNKGQDARALIQDLTYYHRATLFLLRHGLYEHNIVCQTNNILTPSLKTYFYELDSEETLIFLQALDESTRERIVLLWNKDPLEKGYYNNFTDTHIRYGKYIFVDGLVECIKKDPALLENFFERLQYLKTGEVAAKRVMITYIIKSLEVANINPTEDQFNILLMNFIEVIADDPFLRSSGGFNNYFTNYIYKIINEKSEKVFEARIEYDLAQLIGNKITPFGLASFIAQVIGKKDKSSIQIIHELRKALYVNPQYADIVNKLLQREAKYETKRNALGYIAESLSIANSYDEGANKANTQETINTLKETIGQYSKGEIGDKKFLNQLKNTSFKFKTTLFNELLSKPISEEEMEQIGQRLDINKLFSLTGIYFRIREQDVKDKIRIVLDKLVEFQGDIKKLDRWLYEESEWNKEEMVGLIKAGYDSVLWTEGVGIEEEVSSREAGEALKQLNKQTEQLIEIAEKLGIPVSEETKRNGLNSYQEAKQFTDEVIVPATDKEKMLTDLSGILNETERLEKIYQDTKIRKEMVRVEIKKDFLEDAYSGVGVPGCFNPITGIHKEAPLVHALESNGFFLRVYQQEKMIANAVIVLTDKGAVVFGLYNSTNLNLDEAVFEAIKELSRKVPMVLMTSQSVSFDKAKLYGQEETVLATKHEKVIEEAYHDFGESANGNTIFDMSLSLTQDMIQEKGGFKEKPKRTVAVMDKGPKGADFNWDGLAKSMISQGLKDYLFLIGELKKDKVDMNTVTRETILGTIIQKGRQISNNDLDRMYGIIQPSLNAATTVDLGAQVSHIKKLDNLLRILNILRKSENVPEISESTSNSEIIEFCINELKTQGLMEETTDEYGNRIIKIKKEAESNRLAQAIREWAIDKDGGVRAINFQGTDGAWIIIGFASELEDKNTLEHEQKEIAYRQHGLSWQDAHNKTVEDTGIGTKLDIAIATEYKAGQQDEIGTSSGMNTEEFQRLINEVINNDQLALGRLIEFLTSIQETDKINKERFNFIVENRLTEKQRIAIKNIQLFLDYYLELIKVVNFRLQLGRKDHLKNPDAAIAQYGMAIGDCKKIIDLAGDAFLEENRFLNNLVEELASTAKINIDDCLKRSKDPLVKFLTYFSNENLPFSTYKAGVPWHIFYNNPEKIPDEGWKLYITGTTENVEQIYRIVLPFLVEKGIAHKVANSLGEVKAHQTGAESGRIIVIYPENAEVAVNLAKILYEMLKDKEFTGPSISEAGRIKDSTIYYRYAEILKSYYINPDTGEEILDNKQFKIKPPWIKEDPFEKAGLLNESSTNETPTSTVGAVIEWIEPLAEDQAEGGMITPDILKGWIKEGDIPKLVAHITRGLQGQDDNVINGEIKFIIGNLEESKRNEFIQALKEKGIIMPAEAVAKMTQLEQEKALAWFYHGQEAGGMSDDVRREAATAFEKLPEGKPTQVRRGIRFDSEEEREAYLRQLESDGYIPREGAESFSEDERTAEGASTSKAPVIIVWNGRTKPLRGVKNQLLQVLGIGGQNIDMSAEVEHIVTRSGTVEKIIKREDGKVEVYIRDTSLEKTQGVTSLNKPGGIDFRVMPIVTRPMQPSLGTVPLGAEVSPLAGLPPIGQVGTVSVELDKEWQQIQNMLNAGMVPSNQRIKDYLQACCQTQDSSQEIDKVLTCIADILRLEEERVSVTDPVLKDFLVLLESDKSANELQLAFSKITVSPGEPKPFEP